jgi:methionyl-tRNA formyltransferase
LLRLWRVVLQQLLPGTYFYARMDTIFFGSADFAIPILSRLVQEHRVVGVVTTPPKPQGRGLKPVESPVAVFARGLRLAPVFEAENLNDPDFQKKIAGCRADIFIVVAFRILPKALFSLPPFGTINVHASLLPKYRGPAPVQRAIEAGEKETGVTVFRIDEGVDTGGVLLQKRVSIDADETSVQLHDRLSVCGTELLAETLKRLARGTLQPVSQDSTQASRAPKLTKGEALINWSQTAMAINNKIRAFKPFPGTYTVLNGRRLGIERAQPLDAAVPGDAGTVLEIGDSFFDIRCGEGALRVFEVKPESRRSMSVRDFLAGNSISKGTMFK